MLRQQIIGGIDQKRARCATAPHMCSAQYGSDAVIPPRIPRLRDTALQHIALYTALPLCNNLIEFAI